MFAHTRLALICNAPIGTPKKTKERLATFPVLIAVDGGLNHCHALGLRPHLLVGDFDSADPELLKSYSDIPQKRHPREKDETDLELALTLLFQPHVEEITVFGALGNRTDHTLGNVILLSRYPGKLFLESDRERLFVIDQHVELAVRPGQFISLIPLNGPVKGVDTEGLKWPLKNATLDKQFIGISNEATGSQVTISVKEGDLLCCINEA